MCTHNTFSSSNKKKNHQKTENPTSQNLCWDPNGVVFKRPADLESNSTLQSADLQQKHFYLFINFVFFREIKIWHFMWVIHTKLKVLFALQNNKIKFSMLAAHNCSAIKG